jgi:hypothetical protein
MGLKDIRVHCYGIRKLINYAFSISGNQNNHTSDVIKQITSLSPKLPVQGSIYYHRCFREFGLPFFLHLVLICCLQKIYRMNAECAG